MQLTAKEEKIARLALDKGAKDGERASAAAKLIESLYKRGVTVEDIEKETVRTEVVYREVPVTPTWEEYAPPPPSPPPPPPDPDGSEWREHVRRKEAAQEEWKRRNATVESTVEPSASVAAEQIQKYAGYVVGFLIVVGIALFLIGLLISVIVWLCQYPAVVIFGGFVGALFLCHYFTAR